MLDINKLGKSFCDLAVMLHVPLWALNLEKNMMVIESIRLCYRKTCFHMFSTVLERTQRSVFWTCASLAPIRVLTSCHRHRPLKDVRFHFVLFCLCTLVFYFVLVLFLGNSGLRFTGHSTWVGRQAGTLGTPTFNRRRIASLLCGPVRSLDTNFHCCQVTETLNERKEHRF